MSLQVYYFKFSQCDRVVWLWEELSDLDPTFKYELIVFPRGLPDSEGKQKFMSLHPSGTSPTIVDNTVAPPVTMTESQAILEYIVTFHGKGRFQIQLSAGPQIYSQYLYWMSFANGSFQAFISAMTPAASLIAKPGSNIDTVNDWAYQNFAARIPNHPGQYNDHLATCKYLVGDELSGADMMNIYGLTMMRGFYHIDLTDYPHILRWLKDVTSRPAYRRTMGKAEDGLPPMIQAKVPQVTIEMAIGISSWRDAPAWKDLSLNSSHYGSPPATEF